MHDVLAEIRVHAMHLRAHRHRLAALAVQGQGELLGGQAIGMHRQNRKGSALATRPSGNATLPSRDGGGAS